METVDWPWTNVKLQWIGVSYDEVLCEDLYRLITVIGTYLSARPKNRRLCVYLCFTLVRPEVGFQLALNGCADPSPQLSGLMG